MKQSTLSITACLAFLGCAHSLFAASPLTIPDLKIGSNLQKSTYVLFDEPISGEGLQIKLTSSDPELVLLSTDPRAVGSSSLELEIKPNWNKSQPFWVQATGSSGIASYTVTAPGFPAKTSQVEVTGSAVLLMGPAGSPSFLTTPKAPPSKLMLYAARLDESQAHVEEQLAARDLRVRIHSSDPLVGKAVPGEVTIAAGSSVASVAFEPSLAGRTTLSLELPEGLCEPVKYETLSAIVSMPGLAITGNMMIGNGLQVEGTLGLGQLAPPGGVTVTLRSSKPSLLLSESSQKVGEQELKLHVPEGEVQASYFLQAFDAAGQIEYTAEAGGYQSRTAKITLAPSGVVIAPKEYGPPDEAELLREDAAKHPRGLVTDISGDVTVPVRVWTVQLDPVTLRSADITVQPLGPRGPLQVELTTRDPKIGKVASPMLLAPSVEVATTEFTALTPGSTQVEVKTPEGFSRSMNSSEFEVIVRKPQ